MTPIFDAPSPAGWMRVDYLDTRATTVGGKAGASIAPAIPIRVRHPRTTAPLGAANTVQVRAVIDTGANVSAVPLWAANYLGIEVGDADRQTAIGAGGRIDAYRVEVGMDVRIDGRWLDTGIITALAPDTDWSRRREARLPFLLGRNGFLDKFNACFDEPDRAVWLRRIGARAAAGRP